MDLWRGESLVTTKSVRPPALPLQTTSRPSLPFFSLSIKIGRSDSSCLGWTTLVANAHDFWPSHHIRASTLEIRFTDVAVVQRRKTTYDFLKRLPTFTTFALSCQRVGLQSDFVPFVQSSASTAEEKLIWGLAQLYHEECRDRDGYQDARLFCPVGGDLSGYGQWDEDNDADVEEANSEFLTTPPLL